MLAAAAAAKSLQSCPTVRPHRWQPTRLPRPWDSPGKNTGVGCHFLLQCLKEKSESEAAQSCPTFSNPMDCSLPGSSVHGISQARVLEWGAISISNTWKWKVKEKSLSRVRLFATPWTVAHQAPPSMGFSRQEYWSGVPSPSPKKYLTQVIIFTAFNVCWTNTQCIQRNENTVGNMPTCHHHAQTGRNSSWNNQI